ncbi:hypothetical protein F5Y17DRAFT_411706 [Xylariaceae sp. FL0594]|nr:hypothetical protein F5Y17DRAFT_411706 [Xylariaceae sp. FL0594]
MPSSSSQRRAQPRVPNYGSREQLPRDAQRASDRLWQVNHRLVDTVTILENEVRALRDQIGALAAGGLAEARSGVERVPPSPGLAALQGLERRLQLQPPQQQGLERQLQGRQRLFPPPTASSQDLARNHLSQARPEDPTAARSQAPVNSEPLPAPVSSVCVRLEPLPRPRGPSPRPREQQPPWLQNQSPRQHALEDYRHQLLLLDHARRTRQSLEDSEDLPQPLPQQPLPRDHCHCHHHGHDDCCGEGS